jgi:hypothetical protein
VGTLSVLRFIPMGVFDGATIRTIGKAFDAACKELRDGGQPSVVHEVMIKRIIAAARKGERNVIRLRDAALTGLEEPRNQIRDRQQLADLGERRPDGVADDKACLLSRASFPRRARAAGSSGSSRYRPIELNTIIGKSSV